MRTPAGTECRFYYEDYFRGHETQECRLIARNPRSAPWKPSLCAGCPVPGILRANSCPNMALEAHVERRLRFWQRVAVEAFCTKYLTTVDNPYVGCGHCPEERARASILDLPVAPASPPDER